MVSVFNDLSFLLKNEQSNLDVGGLYQNEAKVAISLAGIKEGSSVLDLGCGTGHSTCALVDSVPDVSVVGIDKEITPLILARLRFGQINNIKFFFEYLYDNPPYPDMLRKECNLLNLEQKLREDIQKYSQFQDRVKFSKLDAAKITGLLQTPFDYVLANQAIHWFRKKDIKDGKFNLKYEKNVLKKIRKSLKDEGLFIFNTSGADYEFENEELNAKHLTNHPFYKAFSQSVNSQLGKAEEERHYTFDNHEIKKVLHENGFSVVARKDDVIVYKPKLLEEVCLVGGHMGFFQSRNSDVPIKEQEKILQNALEFARSKVPLYEFPEVMETAVHYVAQKR